jgi:hypothetical protein
MITYGEDNFGYTRSFEGFDHGIFYYGATLKVPTQNQPVYVIAHAKVDCLSFD